MHYRLHFTWPAEVIYGPDGSIHEGVAGSTVHFTITTPNNKHSARFQAEVLTSEDSREMTANRPIFGYQMIFVDAFDQSAVERTIEFFVLQHEELPWAELLNKLGRLATPENEHYTFMGL